MAGRSLAALRRGQGSGMASRRRAARGSGSGPKWRLLEPRREGDVVCFPRRKEEWYLWKENVRAVRDCGRELYRCVTFPI